MYLNPAYLTSWVNLCLYPSLLHCEPSNEQSTCLCSSEAPLDYYKIWLTSQRMLHFALRQKNHLLQSGLTKLVQGAITLQGRTECRIKSSVPQGRTVLSLLPTSVCVITEQHFIRDFLLWFLYFQFTLFSVTFLHAA